MPAAHMDPETGSIERFLSRAMQIHGHAFAEIPVDMACSDQVKSLIQTHNEILSALRKLGDLIDTGVRTYHGSPYLYLKGMLGHFRAVILHYEMITENGQCTEPESLPLQ